jgi:hypothetical protein
MSDDLRTRIAAVLSEHVENQLTNYDAERNECGCGHQGDATYRDHLADAVIEALGIYEDEMGTGATRRTRIVSDWEQR